MGGARYGFWGGVLWVLALSACNGAGQPAADVSTRDAMVPVDATSDLMRTDAMADTTPDTTPDPTNLAEAIVRTQDGVVQGEVDDTLAIFKGIPYAAPPTGDLRWRPPQRPAPWTQALDAKDFGPVCPQISSPVLENPEGSGLPNATYSDDCPESCTGSYCCKGQEDCLTLNVWTPAKTTDDALPVMVWIHGGGWNCGTGSQPQFDGEVLARRGDVIVVTFNYRLGLLGFLAHPLLTAESEDNTSGNYGMLDQVHLLKWVRDNIASFGGNPQNVTIFGESAGGGSVCYLVASPRAKDLFHRGIIESAPCPEPSGFRFLDKPAPISQTESAHEQGEKAEAVLGCETKADRLQCLRALSPGTLNETIKPSTGAFVGDADVRFWPIADGYFLPDAPKALIDAGSFNKVPIIGGANANELGLWRNFVTLPGLGVEGDVDGNGILTLADANADATSGNGDPDPLSSYPKRAMAVFGLLKYEEALALYPPAATGAAAVLAYEQMTTDLTFICPTRRYLRAFAAAGTPAWSYYFARVAPGSYAGRHLFGAIHGSEIMYAFGTLDAAAPVFLPLTREDEDLSAEMMDYWLRFAKTGDPNGNAAFQWPATAATVDSSIILDWPLKIDGAFRKTQCDFIDTFRASDICKLGGTRPLACTL